MAIKKIKSKRNRKGLVLPLVATIVVVLLITGLALLRLGYTAQIRASRGTADISARAAADSGLTQAVYLMNKKATAEVVWDNSSLPSATDVALTNSKGSFSFDITGDPSAGFTITSTGRSGTSTKAVYGILKVKPLWTGLLVKDGCDIKNSAGLGAIPPGADFAIRTNSIADASILFKTGVVVPGDVVVGPGGDVETAISTKKDTVIEGQAYAAEEEISFPPVVVPDELESLPTSTYTYSAGVPITGNIKYSSIVIPNGAIQQVTGECMIYVLGDITLQNGSELVVTAGSSLTIYLKGNLIDMNSTGISNQTNDSTKFHLYGLDTCTSIDIKAKSDFYGAIYAPEANIVVRNGGDLIGAFVGTNFEMKNSGDFYYDTALADTDINDHVAFLGLKRW